MPKIKPFNWNHSGENIRQTSTSFGDYLIYKTDRDQFKVRFHEVIGVANTIEQAKRLAFDDFKRRLEETLAEPVGYDLPIDENC